MGSIHSVSTSKIKHLPQSGLLPTHHLHRRLQSQVSRTQAHLSIYHAMSPHKTFGTPDRDTARFWLQTKLSRIYNIFRALRNTPSIYTQSTRSPVMSITETRALMYSLTLDRIHQLALPITNQLHDSLLDAFLAAGY